LKYSIRGNMNLADGTEIVNVLNNYSLWRLVTNTFSDEVQDKFTFEAWVNTPGDKDDLFTDLKPFVDEYGEVVDWHECSHDEAVQTPCVIAEEYRGV
jgi:hypothetical protein